MSARGGMPQLIGMRSADMRLAEMPPPTPPTHATNHPSRTLRVVSARVPDVWWRHPADLVHHGAGPDPEGPHPLGRTTRTAADFSRSRAARRLGRARPGSGSWAQYAPAGLIFTITEDGTDTTVNWSGTLNTGGLTVEVTLDTQAGTGVLGNTTTIALMDSSPKLRFNQPFAEVDPNSWTVFGLQ
jgi:hypothetical protein